MLIELCVRAIRNRTCKQRSVNGAIRTKVSGVSKKLIDDLVLIQRENIISRVSSFRQKVTTQLPGLNYIHGIHMSYCFGPRDTFHSA